MVFGDSDAGIIYVGVGKRMHCYGYFGDGKNIAEISVAPTFAESVRQIRTMKGPLYGFALKSSDREMVTERKLDRQGFRNIADHGITFHSVHLFLECRILYREIQIKIKTVFFGASESEGSAETRRKTVEYFIVFTGTYDQSAAVDTVHDLRIWAKKSFIVGRKKIPLEADIPPEGEQVKTAGTKEAEMFDCKAGKFDSRQPTVI